MSIPRFDRVEDLVRPEALARVLGPVRRVTVEPLSALSSFSGARHDRLHVELEDGARETLVLKRARPRDNWIARRTGDAVGREAALLAEPAFAGVWDVFARTYVAFAVADGELGLLMVDLSEWLHPDVREPIDADVERRILDALAALHARYWQAPALDRSWLGDVGARSRSLHPSLVDDPGERALMPPPLVERVVQGWRLAADRLPAASWRTVRAPVDDHARDWARLPRTLIHGDAKVANLAPMPNGRIAAFDWETVSAAPATFDVTWYLIVNATRLARPRDEFLRVYRESLERERGAPIADSDWRALLGAGVVAASQMLLWSKAMACAEGRAGAEDEWRWWVERLEDAAAR